MPAAFSVFNLQGATLIVIQDAVTTVFIRFMLGYIKYEAATISVCESSSSVFIATARMSCAYAPSLHCLPPAGLRSSLLDRSISIAGSRGVPQ